MLGAPSSWVLLLPPSILPPPPRFPLQLWLFRDNSGPMNNVQGGGTSRGGGGGEGKVV